MSLNASLTVDLDNFVSSKAREKFYEELKKKQFVRRKLTTLWTVSFTPTTSRAWVERYVRDSVEAAALSAGISTYEAFVSISETPPIEWRTGTNNTLLAGLLRFQN
ncbi:hypothetical protein [Pseudomonas sp. Pseu.R1]|uniref:hypothetical protein n=1 Tax=Pseudomonas sp. Pseu.R1 TaxID=3379818 RepID=UPI003B95BB9F